jgi:hypothetical protein
VSALVEVSEIAEKLNARAATLAPSLLPNGRRAGAKWIFSGIADTGKSESAWLELSGPRIGHWRDAGNCAAGEEKGDLLDLVRLKECGGDVGAAVQWAKRELGIEDRFMPGVKLDPAEKARRAADARKRAEDLELQQQGERERKAKGARRLFLEGGPIKGTPAAAYLRGRGLHCGELSDWPGSLRFYGEAYHGTLKAKLPAMLAGIFTAEGKQIGTHRTFLQHCPARGWCKIDDAAAKMVLGNVWGGFVPVNKGASGKSMAQMPAGEPVFVTEGIEDAIVLRMAKPEARIVCALNLPNLGAIVLPEPVRELVVVADRDVSASAQETLARSIAAQQARGLTVKLVMPPVGVKDLNDWLLSLPTEARRA